MQRGDVGFVAGLAGFFLGAFAAFTAASMKPDVESLINERHSDEDQITTLGAHVDENKKELKELALRVGGLSSAPKDLRESIERLRLRVEALEQGRNPPNLKDGEPKAADAKSEASQDEFDALRKKVVAGQATDEEKAKFWKAARERPDLMDAVINDLAKKVAESPRDIDARMLLAHSYIQKLYTVPDGPQRGALSQKAEEQWNAVLEIEPNNWDAHVSLGFNYSFWPEQFNKGPDAIKQFETARKIQEASTPDPDKHPNTYVQLYKLYVKAGKTDQAKAVLDEGLRRFPDDEDLKKLK